MKRIVIIFAMLAASLSAMAQKVTSNERDEKGVRKIETGIRAFYVEHSMHGCQLSYTEQEGQEWYVLSLIISDQTSKWVIKEGKDMLMKNEEGDVYEIKTKGVSICNIAKNTTSRGVGYAVTTLFYLTPQEAQIFDNGLAKIRLPYTFSATGEDDLMDIEIPHDLTSYLKKAKKNIDKTIPMPVSIDKSIF